MVKIKNNIIFLLLILFTILSVLFIYNNNLYTFKYFHNKDKVVLTSVLHQGKTFFVEGYYNKEDIPNSYIEPIYSGISGSYNCCFMKNKDTCFIYYSNGVWKDNSKSSKFLLVQKSYDYIDSLYKLFPKKMTCIYGGETGAIIITK